MSEAARKFSAYRTVYGPNRTARNEMVHAVLVSDYDALLARYDAAEAQLAESRRCEMESYRVNEALLVRLAKAERLLAEFVDLCAVGDVDETTEALGWGSLIRRAKAMNEHASAGTPAGERRFALGAARQGVGASAVIDEIAAERRRQIEVEGWTAEHDDQHDDGSLSRVAACYASHVADLPEWLFPRWAPNGRPLAWPVSWSREWWKPKGWRRDLVRAAALIVAEIERRDRAATQEPPR